MATRILFFGQLKEAAGVAERAVDIPPHISDAASLIAFVSDGNPYLLDALNAPSVRIALDHELIQPDATFDAPKEIAFMPPFSGG